MPLYEYECPGCDRVVEILVRGDQEVPQCPECGRDQLTRVLSVPAAPASAANRQGLPMASPGEGCGLPRCCGGGCDL